MALFLPTDVAEPSHSQLCDSDLIYHNLVANSRKLSPSRCNVVLATCTVFTLWVEIFHKTTNAFMVMVKFCTTKIVAHTHTHTHMNIY